MIRNSGVWLSTLLLWSCTDPLTPEFQFEDGLLFIEGFASTQMGASFVTINTSTTEFGRYRVTFVPGAAVTFENEQDGRSVALIEEEERYLPPDDFFAREGERWRLRIALSNGKIYESTAEEVLASIPISAIDITYDPELEFREIAGGAFIPGHQVAVSLEDPQGTDNYYYWSYRTYESLDFCQQCFEGAFRDNECLGWNTTTPYFLYICEVDCWRIRYPESIAIFSDTFSDGKSISKLPIGNLPLYTYENMVVEVQQFSISTSAYEYYKVLKDIVDNSSGLNAPPPAALVGNIFNPTDGEEFVFGRFTATATSVASAFIEREGIAEEALETRDAIILEDPMVYPVPPGSTIFAPCEEGKFRTAIPPNGWINR